MSRHFDSFYYTCKYHWLYYFDLWQTAFLLMNINIVWINTALLCMCIRHHFITMHMGVWTKLEILILFNHAQIWWRKVRGLQLSVYFINIAHFLSNALVFVFVSVFFLFFVFFFSNETRFLCSFSQILSEPLQFSMWKCVILKKKSIIELLLFRHSWKQVNDSLFLNVLLL